MLQRVRHKTQTPTIPLHSTDAQALANLPEAVQQWAASMGFTGAPRTLCCVPMDGGLDHVLYGPSTEPHEKPWDGAFLVESLPEGHVYAIEEADEAFLLAWELAGYHYHHGKKEAPKRPILEVDSSVDLVDLGHKVSAVTLVRDLINAPANIMTPEKLAQEAKRIADQHGAHFSEVVGEDLIRENYPLIYTVGKASAVSPRLVHIQWGDPSHKKISLVGKGITFDTGGLNIKTGSYMNLMKKDMGGAAHALAMAHLLMASNVPVHLNLYLPLAENAVAGNAMRPGDVVAARNDLSVEIGDTDAEGRLVLADALAKAVEEAPDLLLDFATLTGAARVAVGTEIPAFFTNQKGLTKALAESPVEPLWPLPLWSGYKDFIKSGVADLKNIGSTPYGGATTAALFLEAFVKETPWIHVDLMAWNSRSRPGRPVGGEAQGLFPLFDLLRNVCVL